MTSKKPHKWPYLNSFFFSKCPFVTQSLVTSATIKYFFMIIFAAVQGLNSFPKKLAKIRPKIQKLSPLTGAKRIMEKY